MRFLLHDFGMCFRIQFRVLPLKRKFDKSFRTITPKSSNRTVLFSSIWIRFCAPRSSSSPLLKRWMASLHSALFMFNSSFVVANSDLSVAIKLTRWTLSAEARVWLLVDTIFRSISLSTSGIFSAVLLFLLYSKSLHSRTNWQWNGH